MVCRELMLPPKLKPFGGAVQGFVPINQAPSMFLCSSFSIAAGGSLGPEAPLLGGLLVFPEAPFHYRSLCLPCMVVLCDNISNL